MFRFLIKKNIYATIKRRSLFIDITLEATFRECMNFKLA